MEAKGLLTGLILFLVWASVYTIDTLEDMKDLRDKTDFGKAFPRHGLKILLWLICQGQIDQNGVLQLNFNPAQNVFGIHRYSDHERVFPALDNLKKKYYTVGSIGPSNVRKHFPDYVTEDYCKSWGHPLRNVDRVVIRVQADNPSRVDEVYITQHYLNKNRREYDLQNTFRLSTKLLQEILEFCPDILQTDNQNHRDNQNDPNNPGLLRFLIKASYKKGKKGKGQHSKSSNLQSGRQSRSHDCNCDMASIKDYEAGLQLYEKDSYACLRLFIKKSFTDWRKVFRYSWVGLYTSTEVSNSVYQKYTWITDFEKSSEEDDYEDEYYDVYEYQSSVAIAPGIQARVMLDKGYTAKIAHTEPWPKPLSTGSSWGFWISLLFILLAIFVIKTLIDASRIARPAPPFVDVSEGRPGL